ncbi:MAG: nucleoside deaminase [Acidobacteriota bacterium]
MNLTALPDDPLSTETDRELIGRTYEIARAGGADGGRPFGSVLVHDGQIIAEFKNLVQETGDVTQHAESGLVAMVSQKHSRDLLTECTLYTSTEPCIMCCGAIYWAGISGLVYGTTASQMSQLLGREYLSIPSREVFQRIQPCLTVVGPVREVEGLKIHADYP